MWKLNVKDVIIPRSWAKSQNHAVVPWWVSADCAITYRLTKSAQPAVGAAKHHRQKAYLTAIFGHYIGGYFNWMRLQSQIDCTTNIDNNTKTLSGDRRQDNSYHACANWSAKSPEVGILNEVRYAGFPLLRLCCIPFACHKGAGETV